MDFEVVNKKVLKIPDGSLVRVNVIGNVAYICFKIAEGEVELMLGYDTFDFLFNKMKRKRASIVNKNNWKVKKDG